MALKKMRFEIQPVELKNIKKIFWSPHRFYFIIFQKCRTREEKRKLNFSSISNYNSLNEYKKFSF